MLSAASDFNDFKTCPYWYFLFPTSSPVMYQHNITETDRLIVDDFLMTDDYAIDTFICK